MTQALLGEPIEAVDHHTGWTRIRTAYGYEGWISDLEIDEEDGELPAPSGRAPLEIARSYLGAPYLWGGLTHDGIDCSGLVHIAHRLAGRLVPRDAWQQELSGVPLSIADASPGDCVTYGTGERADHIAFWLGQGTILHATGRETLGVVEEPEPVALQSTRRLLVRL